MTITIKIPETEEILVKGIDVCVAPTGTKWSELDLGDNRNEIGVYVIHHNGNIKYVGKTNGESM